jgi:hypothetical protein
MWTKIKNKVIECISTLVAFICVVLIGTVTLIVPVTLILICVKLIMMMFGV